MRAYIKLKQVTLYFQVYIRSIVTTSSLNNEVFVQNTKQNLFDNFFQLIWQVLYKYNTLHPNLYEGVRQPAQNPHYFNQFNQTLTYKTTINRKNKVIRFSSSKRTKANKIFKKSYRKQDLQSRMLNIIFEGMKDNLSRLFEFVGGYYLLSMSSFILKKAITFCCCTLIAIQVFIVAYYFMIPNMQQELTLHFQKDIHDHYLGYYFNQDHKDTICNSFKEKQAAFQKIAFEEQNGLNQTQNISTNEELNVGEDSIRESKHKNIEEGGEVQVKKQILLEIDSDLKTLCSIHIHNQRHELFFERESYQMNLRLVLFDLENKGFSKGIIPLEITILDRNGDFLQLKKVIHFNQNQQKRNLLERIIYSVGNKALSTLGLQVDENLYEIDQILFEKLPNTLIDLQAIIIKIQDVGIFIQDSQLIINPILQHVRYYLYYWFYSTSVVMILAIATYLFILFQIYQCLKPFIQESICKKRKPHFD